MNIILAEEDELSGSRIILTDHRADHIIKVLRADVGDTVRFGIVDGMRGQGRITGLVKKHPRSVTLELELAQPMGQIPRIDMVIAMARPIMMRRILSQATALGVGTFHITHANRVEKSFWEATMLEQENYFDYLRQGLEQSVDTRMPQVLFHRRFKPFVEDYLSDITGSYSHCLLAHPDGSATLEKVLRNNPDRVLLAIGPEGGWVDYEVMKFEEAGFSVCSIGERILKVDTAVVALHARVSQLCGE